MVPTVHEPCLYLGIINGKRTLLKQQVDNFAIATPNEHTANILLDLIDDELSMIPMKCQGYLNMYNRIDVPQMRNYIKISTTTSFDKICNKYLSSWMNNFTTTEDRPMPLPSDPS